LPQNINELSATNTEMGKEVEPFGWKIGIKNLSAGFK